MTQVVLLSSEKEVLVNIVVMNTIRRLWMGYGSVSKPIELTVG